MLPLRVGALSRWHTLLPWCCQVHCTGPEHSRVLTQVDSSKLQRLSLARGSGAAARDRLLTRASAPSVQSSLHARNRAWPGPVSPAESMLRASSAQPLSRNSGKGSIRLKAEANPLMEPAHASWE